MQIEFFSNFFKQILVLIYTLHSLLILLYLEILILLVLFDSARVIVLTISADIIEDNENLRKVVDVCVLIEAIQREKNIIHVLKGCLSKSARRVWHYALDEATYAFCRIIYPLSQGVGHLNKDVFVRSINVTVIKAGRVYQCYIPNSTLLYTWSHRFEGFHTFECAGLCLAFEILF